MEQIILIIEKRVLAFIVWISLLIVNKQLGQLEKPRHWIFNNEYIHIYNFKNYRWMAIFSQIESQINRIQIQETEIYAGLKFPNEYKEHLLKFNGGQCVPKIFKFNENGKWTDSYIDWFLAIYNGKYDNLREYIKDYKLDKKRLPTHMLPIAHDPGGNLICISTDTEDKGCIYFWDHENEVDYNITNDRDYSNLYMVARSFNEFIDGLKDDFEP
ncbi:MAG: SMI1/KNR4 family protein [Ferruginibacter sp.]